MGCRPVPIIAMVTVSLGGFAPNTLEGTIDGAATVAVAARLEAFRNRRRVRLRDVRDMAFPLFEMEKMVVNLCNTQAVCSRPVREKGVVQPIPTDG
jgi:hypothetical protein